MLHTLGHFSELEESKGVQRRKPLEKQTSWLLAASRYPTGLRTERRAHTCKTPSRQGGGTGYNGFGSVDALRAEIEGRHPRASRGSATSTALILTQ